MTNEISAILTFVGLATMVLVCLRMGRAFLFSLSAFIIVASNATVAMTADIFGVSVSLGVIIYSLAYLITDALSEFYEKNAAYKLAVSNLLVQALFWAYIFLVIPVRVDDASMPLMEGFQTLYSTTPRITVAAFVASLGAFLDIYIYEQMKRAFEFKNWEGKIALAVRNNVSTMIGQAVNTTLFFGIALYGVVENLGAIIFSAIVIKIAVAFLDTPFLIAARSIMPAKITKRLSDLD